jgi:catechol 2,3-dioxygenase-like lactoylglutathione lyase family enzyme
MHWSRRAAALARGGVASAPPGAPVGNGPVRTVRSTNETAQAIAATPIIADPQSRPGHDGYDSCVITGVHAVVFSPAAEKVRAFFGDVLGLPSADAGGDWLIFALPPAELAVHPADAGGRHELYLMCDDIHATLAELRDKGVEVAREVSDQGWGLLAAVRLPDGAEFPIYQPRHPSPLQP